MVMMLDQSNTVLMGFVTGPSLDCEGAGIAAFIALCARATEESTMTSGKRKAATLVAARVGLTRRVQSLIRSGRLPEELVHLLAGERRDGRHGLGGLAHPLERTGARLGGRVVDAPETDVPVVVVIVPELDATGPVLIGDPEGQQGAPEEERVIRRVDRTVRRDREVKELPRILESRDELLQIRAIHDPKVGEVGGRFLFLQGLSLITKLSFVTREASRKFRFCKEKQPFRLFLWCFG